MRKGRWYRTRTAPPASTVAPPGADGTARTEDPGRPDREIRLRRADTRFPTGGFVSG